MEDHLGDTELILGLPGGDDHLRQEGAVASPEAVVSGGRHKRGFVETANENDGVDFDSLSSNNGKSSIEYHVVDDRDHHKFDLTEATSEAPPTKAQVIGWPPVRSCRKKVFERCKYVKVAADGVPYLRKVDLETFNSYQHLLTALNNMFSCFNIRSIINGGCVRDKNAKLHLKGMVEYVPTFEDKDGDLMLVGDVPWKMFTESCKRIRLMKSSEAVGLAPTTSRDE